MKCKILSISLFSLIVSIFISCNGSGSSEPEVSVDYKVIERELSDPQSLNLLNGQDEMTTYITYIAQWSLIGIDPKTLEFVPTVAKSMPLIEMGDDGRPKFTYEIREEATWDDGSPITGKDIEFSIKVIKNPKVDCERIRPYFDFIQEIIIDENNPKKFTMICKEPYFIAPHTSGDFNLLPQGVYDPEKLMDKFSLKDLTFNSDQLAEDPNIIKFADQFNSAKFQKEVLSGCGPYQFDHWETNQRVVFKKKANWWGDKLANENGWFASPRPSEIVFETITDDATAINALKGLQIDVMRSIDPKIYMEDLPKDSKFTDNFNKSTPAMLAYEYIGMNLKNPKFSDRKVRIALAHLVDYDAIINNVWFGMAEQATSTLHPTNVFYNDTLTSNTYDVAKANKLLDEAGWIDTDGDGIRDKMISGKKVQFKTTISYNQGNPRREKACLLAQESFRQAGIEVEVLNQEWSVFLENQKNHNFEMFVGGWIQPTVESDPKQIWHTDGYNNGDNYLGWGTAESDKLIDDLRLEMDAEKRKPYWWKLQAMIHDDYPVIFLTTAKQRLAIAKKFDAEGTVMRPGYWLQGFKLAASNTQ